MSSSSLEPPPQAARRRQVKDSIPVVLNGGVPKKQTCAIPSGVLVRHPLATTSKSQNDYSCWFANGHGNIFCRLQNRVSELDHVSGRGTWGRVLSLQSALCTLIRAKRTRGSVPPGTDGRMPDRFLSYCGKEAPLTLIYILTDSQKRDGWRVRPCDRL